jgi:hypothetical protein
MTADGHDCTALENLQSISGLEPAGAEMVVQRFECAVCGSDVVETFRLDTREVEQ